MLGKLLLDNCGLCMCKGHQKPVGMMCVCNSAFSYCNCRFLCFSGDGCHSGRHVLHEVGRVWNGVEALLPVDSCLHISWLSVWHYQSCSFSATASQASVTPCQYWWILLQYVPC